MQMIIGILEIVLAPTLIVAAVAWLARTFFKQGLSRDIEKFKARLKAEQNHANSTLQAQLDARLFEHQTRFSTYHQKQSEVLAKTYELLFDPYQHIRELVHPLDEHGDPSPERRQEVIDMFNDLSGYFNKNRIYLPETICDKMDVVLHSMKEALRNNLLGRREQGSNLGLTLWQDSWKTMEEKVPPLIDELEQEFRKSVSLARSATDDAVSEAQNEP